MWAAVVGGPITAIVTAVLTYLLSPERMQRSRIGTRRRALAGTWRGTLHQDTVDPRVPATSNVTFVLQPRYRTIKGKGRLRFVLDNEEHELAFTLRGGLLLDFFLKLDYVNKKEYMVQFGMVILKLHPDGTHLEGKLVGYGALSDRIVNATVSLEKSDD